jgi:hypothetical protein
MQDNVVISVVLIVMVMPPFRSMDVYFNIPYPLHFTDPDPGIQEVGPCMVIQYAGAEYLYRFPADGSKIFLVKILKLPYIVQKGFSHNIEGFCHYQTNDRGMPEWPGQSNQKNV